MSDKLIIDLLNEVREDQKTHSVILIDLQRDVSTNTKGLDSHMEQTQAIKQLVIDNKKEADIRLEKLEEPRKIFGILKKYLIGSAAIVGSAYGIAKAFEYFKF